MDWEGDSYDSWVPDKFKGMHVLLVDSDVSCMLHATSMLEAASYKVTPIAQQAVALALITERGDEFDVVITAYETQDMDFITLLTHIRNMKDDIPIFVMLPELEGRKATIAQTNGADFFLDKPISDYDLKNLWQHVIRVRKIIARDKAGRAANVEREPREYHYQQRIIEDAGCSQYPPDNDPRMNINYQHLLPDPKGKTNLVTLGDDPDYYKYDLQGKGQHTSNQSHTGNERATDGTETNRGSSDSGSKMGDPWDPELHKLLWDPIGQSGNGEGGSRTVTQELNLMQQQQDTDDRQQRSREQVQHQPCTIHHHDVPNIGVTFVSHTPNASIGIQVTCTGPSGLVAQINQVREAYRANALDESLHSSRDPTVLHGANDRVFMPDSLEIGDWRINPRLPLPISNVGLGPQVSGTTNTNLVSLNFGPAGMSTGELNEAYQLFGHIPSPNLSSLLGEGINIQVTQFQWNGGHMAEIDPQNPVLGSTFSFGPDQTYEPFMGNQFLADFETHISSSVPSANNAQIVGFPNPQNLPIDLNPQPQMISAPVSHILNQGQPSMTDGDMQDFQGVEDLNQDTGFNTIPNTENSDKLNQDESFGQLHCGATSGNKDFEPEDM